jgi:hypothetical protein
MRMMSSLLSVVKRHPIITFFVLSYALAWMLVPFGSFGAYGPLVAALIVIPITQGWTGLKVHPQTEAKGEGKLSSEATYRSVQT